MGVSVIDILTGAPPPSLTDDPTLFNRADLPAIGTNLADSRDVAERQYREALAIAQSNPAFYSSTPQAQNAITSFSIEHYWFWQANYPKVELLANDNAGLTQTYLNTSWNQANGLAPIVIMRITPRQKPLPEKPLWATIIGYVAPIFNLIPVVGQFISQAVKFAAGNAVRGWAKEISKTDYSSIDGIFSPQYFPKPIQVPMPLDRAQIMIAQPVYAVPMIAQFIDEVQSNTNPQLVDIPITPDLGNQLVSGNVTIGKQINSSPGSVALAIGAAIGALLLLKH